MCLIDDWSSFRIDDYTEEKHTTMIASFDRRYLELEYYINKIKTNAEI